MKAVRGTEKRGNDGIRFVPRRLVIGTTIVLLSFFFGCGSPWKNPASYHDLSGAGYPNVLLQEKNLRLLVAMPESKEGFARGVRFDRSSVITEARWRGNSFFTKMREEWAPSEHDHAAGPAEEFGIENPPGYAEADIGGPFLKVGVGILEKMSNEPYRFNAAYPLRNAGTWKVQRKDSFVSMRQRLKDASGWGYEYEKRIEIAGDGNGFRIDRRLLNTGDKAIDTDFYAHQFLKINETEIGPGYAMEFAFPVVVEPPDKLRGRVVLKKNRFLWVKPFTATSSAFALIKNIPEGSPNRVKVLLDSLGVGVEIEQTLVPKKAIVFSVLRSICPEIFSDVNLKPGEVLVWSTTYRFFQEDHKDIQEGESEPR